MGKGAPESSAGQTTGVLQRELNTAGPAPLSRSASQLLFRETSSLERVRGYLSTH